MTIAVMAASASRGMKRVPAARTLLATPGTTIERPARYEQRLSPAVAAALPRAVERVLALVGG